MFNQLGFAEIAVLLVLGLFVFGPERLPGLAADAGKALRGMRTWVKGMTEDLKSELGPEVGDLDLRSLHPKELIRKHLLEDDPGDDLVDALAGRPRTSRLAPGETPPWDPDTT